MAANKTRNADALEAVVEPIGPDEFQFQIYRKGRVIVGSGNAYTRRAKAAKVLQNFIQSVRTTKIKGVDV